MRRQTRDFWITGFGFVRNMFYTFMAYKLIEELNKSSQGKEREIYTALYHTAITPKKIIGISKIEHNIPEWLKSQVNTTFRKKQTPK